MIINSLSLFLYILFMSLFTFVNHKMYKTCRAQMRVIHCQDLFIRNLIQACAEPCPTDALMAIIKDRENEIQ